MRIESVSLDGSARSLCILSRPSAEPRCVSPVPVTITCAGSLWSIGLSTRRSFSARARSTGLPTPRSAISLRSETPSAIAWRASSHGRARALDQPALAARGDGQRALAVLVDDCASLTGSPPLSARGIEARLDQFEDARIGEIAGRERRAGLNKRRARRASSSCRRPQGPRPPRRARPTANPRRRREWARPRPGALERRSDRAGVGLRARKLGADHEDRKSPARRPSAASTFSALARGALVTTARLSPRRSAKSSSASAPGDGLERAQPVAIVRFLGVERRGLLVGRQVREVAARRSSRSRRP